jgi:hypothetical protein
VVLQLQSSNQNLCVILCEVGDSQLRTLFLYGLRKANTYIDEDRESVTWENDFLKDASVRLISENYLPASDH